MTCHDMSCLVCVMHETLTFTLTFMLTFMPMFMFTFTHITLALCIIMNHDSCNHLHVPARIAAAGAIELSTKLAPVMFNLAQMGFGSPVCGSECA